MTGTPAGSGPRGRVRLALVPGFGTRVWSAAIEGHEDWAMAYGLSPFEAGIALRDLVAGLLLALADLTTIDTGDALDRLGERVATAIQETRHAAKEN